MVASIYDSTNNGRVAIAFTGETGGVGFLVNNENTKTKALLAERGFWERLADE
jgi:hypothetical protein